MIGGRTRRLLLIAGLGSVAVGNITHASVQVQGNVTTQTTRLQVRSACTGSFVAHDLAHITQTSGAQVHLYDSNGAGVAVGDLNDDGKLDIVLANLDGHNTILWNDGDLKFHPQTLSDGSSRAVNIVDVDGDGRLDIVFTHSLGSITYWHNDGPDKTGAAGSDPVRFTEKALPDVRYPAYTMAWADVNGDGALDLITASYDADLVRASGSSFLFGTGAGVVYYAQHQGGFTAQRLAQSAQSLAILLQDFRGDGHVDLLIGNDFGLGNPSWQYEGNKWVQTDPFAMLTRDTMSLDMADLNNDGLPDLFAADMKPYENDSQALAAWKFTLDSLKPKTASPTIAENVLQIQQSDGSYRSVAGNFGVRATGWTWSSRFGDLDNDGYLDLYAVNGMRSVEFFGQQADNALVEEHQAFHNDQGRRFVAAPNWKLNATTGGRGMTMADLTGDGQLDIIVNNLDSPAQLFENQLCAGSALEVDLYWRASLNTHGLGAELTLKTSTGTYSRQIRSSAGYLSGDPSRVHFGFPDGSQLYSLVIRWPDGVLTTVNTPAPQTLLTVDRA